MHVWYIFIPAQATQDDVCFDIRPKRKINIRKTAVYIRPKKKYKQEGDNKIKHASVSSSGSFLDVSPSHFAINTKITVEQKCRLYRSRKKEWVDVQNIYPWNYICK